MIAYIMQSLDNLLILNDADMAHALASKTRSWANLWSTFDQCA